MELPIDYPNSHWRVRKAAREEYIKRQNGKCYWCNQPLDQDPPRKITNKPIDWSLFPSQFLKNPVHLQHCHDTGWSEGAVHAWCNAYMWYYHQR